MMLPSTPPPAWTTLAPRALASCSIASTRVAAAGSTMPASGASAPAARRGAVLGRVGDDVDDTGREAGVDEHLADQAMQGRAQLGRFQDHRVAAGERHRDGARAEDDRGVPGRDADHHAAGLAYAHRERAWYVG